METLLSGLKGKKIDVNFGSTVVYRGEVVTADGGVLHLKNDDGQDVYVAIEKITAFTECKDQSSRPGFIV